LRACGFHAQARPIIHQEVPRQYQSVFVFIHPSGRHTHLVATILRQINPKKAQALSPLREARPSFYPYSSILLNRSFLENFLLVGNLAFAYPALS
jgi:hypothetical protein